MGVEVCGVMECVGFKVLGSRCVGLGLRLGFGLGLGLGLGCIIVAMCE